MRTKEFRELLDSAHISEGDEIVIPKGKRKKVQKQTTTCPDSHLMYNTKKIFHNCGIRGHVSRECPNPKILCYQCGEPGHMMMNFLNRPLTRGWLTGGIGPIIGLPSSPNIHPTPMKRNARAFLGKCNKCGNIGHKKSCCPEHRDKYGTSVGGNLTSTRLSSKEGVIEEGTSSGKRKFETMTQINRNEASGKSIH